MLLFGRPLAGLALVAVVASFGPAPAQAREVVAFKGDVSAGTVVIRTSERRLYLVMGDGRAIRGRRLNEDTFTVQMIDENERLVSLAKSEIREFEAGTASPMPSFAGKLNGDEIADLLAYLVSLRGF